LNDPILQVRGYLPSRGRRPTKLHCLVTEALENKQIIISCHAVTLQLEVEHTTNRPIGQLMLIPPATTNTDD